jgi:AraC-like DNA-binding protein
MSLSTAKIVKSRVSAIDQRLALGLCQRTTAYQRVHLPDKDLQLIDRQLGTYGMRFQEVLDETRREFVRQLLGNTRLSVREIANNRGLRRPQHPRPEIRPVDGGASRWMASERTRPARASRQVQFGVTRVVFGVGADWLHRLIGNIQERRVTGYG